MCSHVLLKNGFTKCVELLILKIKIIVVFVLCNSMYTAHSSWGLLMERRKCFTKRVELMWTFFVKTGMFSVVQM